MVIDRRGSLSQKSAVAAVRGRKRRRRRWGGSEGIVEVRLGERGFGCANEVVTEMQKTCGVECPA